MQSMVKIAFCILIYSFSFGQEIKKGPYLGQELPGNTPKLFAPGVISKEDREAFLITSKNGMELYFGIIRDRNSKIVTDFYGMHETGSGWSQPEITSFSADYTDGYLAMHPNGSRIYFQSNRPIDPSESGYEWNIWYTDRNNNGWSNPKPIGGPINGINHVSGPSVTNDGTMYYTLMEIGGVQEFYRSKLTGGVYGKPERLPDIVNSVKQQFDSYISPDESYLIFNTMLEDSFGGIDLYVSFRDENDNWSKPINLGPKVNTADDESSATISPDGKYIFFGRNNGKNNLDIYWVDAEFIKNIKASIKK